ncbi:caspase-3-like [Mytilus trossulus]|uniref:caspase-3-like n=1 Tax=Mytilus trossulus TaxID=6551 RepID=UPI003006CFC3
MDVLEDNVYQTVLNELCDIIETIQGKLRHTISYSIKVKCRTGDFSKSEDRIPLKDVNDREVYFCDEHCIPHSMDDIRNSWFKHHDRYYKKPDQKGLVLIVNLRFLAPKGNPIKVYTVSDEDLRNLLNFFNEELKYQVNIAGYPMTKTELQNYFMEFDRTYLVENSQDYHSFVCVIIGFEYEGGIQTTDIPITIEEIHQIFKSKPGGKFNGKPKLFLIQNMFGPKYPFGQTRSPHIFNALGASKDNSDVLSFSSEIDTDSLVAWSSKPEIYKLKSVGASPFIREFVSVAKHKYRDEHIEDILSDVIRNLDTRSRYTRALEYFPKATLTSKMKSALTKKCFL